MRISVESEIIQEALRVALRLAPPMTGNVILESSGSRLVLKSASDVARCTVVIPGDVQGEALFAIPPESLRDATKGHKELELSLEKGMLHVTSGRYNSRLATVDAIRSDEDQADGKDKGQVWKLTPEQATWLKGAVQYVTLKSTVAVDSFMPISVKITDKAGFVACYDKNHMSFVNSKEIQGDLNVTLPLETLNAVLDVFNKVSCTMTVTKSRLRVKNKLVDVQLALPHDDNQEIIEFDEVISQAKEAIGAKGKSIEVARADVQNFLDNARSVATKEHMEIAASAEPGKFKLGVTTTNGASKITLKANTRASMSFAVNFEFFYEAVAKAADQLVIKLVDDAFLMTSGKIGYHVMALNQDQ
jgi:hypothetical protein